MSSIFDSEVYARRNHTRWATVGLTAFAKAMAENGADADYEIAKQQGDDTRRFYSGKNDFLLIVESRQDVKSRFWFTVKWTGADGERHQQSAQYLDLCLWRAAQTEVDVQNRVARVRDEEEAAAGGGE